MPSDLDRAYEEARAALLAELRPEGYWPGMLSSSALATATAASALSVAACERFGTLIEIGLSWLARDQNDDGGWGDSPGSPSNVPTTTLAVAAFQLGSRSGRPDAAAVLERAEGYLDAACGTSAAERVTALRRLYGADRTFAVPILANAALADELGGPPLRPEARIEWRHVPSLPFELACLPRSWYKRLRLHVVSYALPALIALGQLIHDRRPTRNPLLRPLRNAVTGRTLGLLHAIQPESGGFLEAVPLTSFVVMSLAAAGRAHDPVARCGVEFLTGLARPDGSWPIDSNLSIWLTTQAVGALAAGGRLAAPVGRETLRWLLAQQHRVEHPYTGSPPGGWAWTHLPGGVPDADDTSGALLALARLGRAEASQAAANGLEWLLNLQNADGGWPTFCRGWGRLPFDRSAPDLTAHALRALSAWSGGDARVARATARAFEYLRRVQRPDGAWAPLWFGNQFSRDRRNPVYGTARVLAAYRDLGRRRSPEARRGLDYLVAAQNGDGGWGGDAGVASSVEETALAVEALSAWRHEARARSACLCGAARLAEMVRSGGLERPAPMGLYFAMLWYSEKLYPIIWTVAALGSVTGNAPDAAGRETAAMTEASE